MQKIVNGIFITLGVFVVIVIIAVIIGWPTMLLWNALMPAIFGFIKISFWQAVGLVLLSSILFKSSSVSSK